MAHNIHSLHLFQKPLMFHDLRILPIHLQSLGCAAFGCSILLWFCGCDNRDRLHATTQRAEVHARAEQDFADEIQALVAAGDYDALFAQRERLEQLASGDNPRMAAVAFAGLMTVDGYVEPAWELAWSASDGFINLLAAMPLLVDTSLRLALAKRALSVLDDDSLSLLSGWRSDERLAARRAVIVAIASIPELEEVQSALETAQQDPALRDAATAALAQLAIDNKSVAPHPVIRRYTMKDLEHLLDWPAGSRSFARGRRAYHELGCHRCHVRSEHDTLVGPNLTSAEYRPSRRELTEAILVPDKQIAENYRQYLLVVEGKPITGLVTEQTDDYLIMIADPLHDCTPRRVERDQLDDEPELLTTSAMPAGMVNVLSQDELLDLLAYVEAKGESRHASFHQRESP